MKSEPVCPRCGAELSPPGLWSSAWQCDEHGPVAPLHAVLPGPERLESVRTKSAVPLWIPWPLPTGWLVTGFAYAGDDRGGAVATALACSGPAPLGGGADMVLVAESPGVGLGARLAGLPGPDPGDGFDDGPPHAKLDATGHPTAMWAIEAAPDVAAYVGEAKAAWLWALLWPAAAGVLLLEDLGIRDLVERLDGVGDLPYGAFCPRLENLKRGGRR